jgi:hypothetical protein
MRKILIAALLFLASNIFSQFQYQDIGSTKIVDSTGYTTMNRSVLFYQNIYVKKDILLDSLAKSKIFYDGYDLNWYNKKETGSYIFYIGNETSKFEVRKYSDASYTSYNPIMRVDSNGINIGIGTGIGAYMIDGTPISGSGSTNLYGYLNKDTAFYHDQHFRTKTFAIYRGSDSDSARFTVDGNGDLIIEPVGSSITLGNTTGTGTKNLYAGNYYIGDTLITNKTLTWTKRAYFTAVDSSIIAKGVKGLTGETMLRLSSPGNGHQGIGIYNSTTSNSIYFYTSNGVALYTMDNNGFWLGDGTTGKPFLTQGAPTTSAVSYTFYGDLNTGLLRNSADNISLVTGGTSRFTLSTSLITSDLPLEVTGTSSYVKVPTLSTAQRDALTAANGMLIYNSDSSKLQVYSAGAWVDLH